MAKLAIVLAFAWAVAPAASFRAPCDLKSTEKKTWCKTCAAYVPRGDVKAGACPKDKTRVETVDVCIKNLYVAKCHPTTTGLKPLTCCGVLYDKPTEDVAKIFWLCAGCKEKGANSALRHLESCTEMKIARTCEKSGTSPHSSIGK